MAVGNFFIYLATVDDFAQSDFEIIPRLFSMNEVVMTGFFMLFGFAMSYYAVGIIYIIVSGKESVLQNIILIPTEVLGIQSVFQNSKIYDKCSSCMSDERSA